eukprot:3768587-Rhodomonas_salina.1
MVNGRLVSFACVHLFFMAFSLPAHGEASDSHSVQRSADVEQTRTEIGTPVVFIYFSTGEMPDYAWGTLRSAACRGNSVVLISNVSETPTDLASEIRFVSLLSLDSSMQNKFNEVYRPWGHVEPWERQNTERYFVLYSWMTREGVDAAFFLDSDVMLFSNISHMTIKQGCDAYVSIPDQHEFSSFDWTAWAGSGYLRRSVLSSYLSFVLDIYSQEPALEFLRKKSKESPFVCDMTTWYLFIVRSDEHQRQRFKASATALNGLPQTPNYTFCDSFQEGFDHRAANQQPGFNWDAVRGQATLKGKVLRSMHLQADNKKFFARFSTNCKPSSASHRAGHAQGTAWQGSMAGPKKSVSKFQWIRPTQTGASFANALLAVTCPDMSGHWPSFDVEFGFPLSELSPSCKHAWTQHGLGKADRRTIGGHHPWLSAVKAESTFVTMREPLQRLESALKVQNAWPTIFCTASPAQVAQNILNHSTWQEFFTKQSYARMLGGSAGRCKQQVAACDKLRKVAWVGLTDQFASSLCLLQALFPHRAHQQETVNMEMTRETGSKCDRRHRLKSQLPRLRSEFSVWRCGVARFVADLVNRAPHCIANITQDAIMMFGSSPGSDEADLALLWSAMLERNSREANRLVELIYHRKCSQ